MKILSKESLSSIYKVKVVKRLSTNQSMWNISDLRETITSQPKRE